VSQKLTKGEGAEATGGIEREPTFRDERETCRGQDGLGEAPPRHRQRVGMVVAQASAFNDRGQEAQ
jgi:hypothetical protein